MSFISKLWSKVVGGVKTGAVGAGAFIRGHKILSAIIALAIIGGGYYGYTVYAAGNAPAQYVLAAATQGPLNVTVTGSGQVSAEDTLNLTPQASGQVTQVNVIPGQSVKAGTIVAELDMTTPAQAVTSARENLTSAQISYQQTLDSTQSGNTNDQTSATTAQTSLNTALTTTFTNLPTVMNGLDSTLYNISTLTGYTAESNIDAYANYVNTTQGHIYHDAAAQAYTNAAASFQQTQSLYASTNGASMSATQAQQLAQSTLSTTDSINNAVKAALTYYSYVNDQITSAKMTQPNQLSAQIASLTSYESTVSGDASSVTSANNSLTSAQQTLTNDSQSLGGSATPLTLQSAQLNVQKAQDSLSQALQNESDYIVRAPFDGVIATVTGKKYDQASSGTTIATLITTQDYADLSLNETDAAKVKVGQPATVTFDALPNVTMTGSVAEVDGIGTVTQGVVTYTVKIGFSQNNPDIKPGMTANATIITASEPSAIQVPSAAVKTSGNFSYVQVATLLNASSTLAKAGGSASSTGARRTRTASSTSAFTGGAGGFASSSARGAFASSSFAGGMSGTTAITTRSLTVSATEVTIKNVPVTVGISSDTMTEILTGLTPGQYVVTATQTASANASKSTAASATSLLGGSTTGRGTGGLTGGSGFTGGGTRTTGAATTRPGG